MRKVKSIDVRPSGEEPMEEIKIEEIKGLINTGDTQKGNNNGTH
jgi:hypothetical protein